MRPTPEMSYAIRRLGCQSGVVVTASHNPKEYNGYKAYWEDGAQVLSPEATRIHFPTLRLKKAAHIIVQLPSLVSHNKEYLFN